MIRVRVLQEPVRRVTMNTPVTEFMERDYNRLDNKPSINSIELSGDKTPGDLRLQEEMEEFSNTEILALWNAH